MMPMAVIASGHIGSDVGFAERHCFSVVGVTVVSEPILMATSTARVACHLEMAILRGLHLVSGMAIGANGPAFVAFGEQLPVHALVVGLFDPNVTLAAGLCNVQRIDR